MNKNIFNCIGVLIKNVVQVLKYSLFSIADPILELADDIFKIQDNFYKTIKNNLKLNQKIVKKLSFVLYYFLIISIILLFSYTIIFYGVIYPISKVSLFLISIGTIILCTAFVIILSAEFKKKIEKYISYGVILIIVPLFFIEWVVSIENHIIYLNQLSADQWINIFEIFTTYFSACFVALVLGYKNIDNN